MSVDLKELAKNLFDSLVPIVMEHSEVEDLKAEVILTNFFEEHLKEFETLIREDDRKSFFGHVHTLAESEK